MEYVWTGDIQCVLAVRRNESPLMEDNDKNTQQKLKPTDHLPPLTFLFRQLRIYAI